MKEEKIQEILNACPGARRAANGVIFDVGDGGLFYATGTTDIDDDLTNDENFYSAFCSKNEILRLRSLRTAHDYLLRVRAESIVDSPRKVREFNRRRDRFEENGRRWSLTEYYHSTNVDAKRYISRLSRLNRKFLKPIPFGLAPINEVNAVAMRGILGEIVVVSENLYNFYYFMNISMYGYLYEIPDKDRIIAAIIALRIVNGAESFDFDIDPRATLPSNVARELRTRTSRQMEFTFGHEFSHLILGHLREEHADSCFDIMTYAHALEYEADRQAVSLVVGSKESKRNVLVGAYDVLLYLYFIELSGINGFIPSFSVSKTHPDALSRLTNIQYIIDLREKSDKKLIYSNIDSILEMIELVSSELKSADRSDILTFYGSIYLPSFTCRLRRDRIDF